MNFDDAVAAIDRRADLPGEAAHRLMMPAYRREPGPFDGTGPWREAAVLVLLYPGEGSRATFPLMQRTGGGGVHAGQISLPGGGREGSEPLWDCARRETFEELGVDPGSVRALASLSPLRVAPSRYVVYPFVGTVAARPRFEPSADEVEELFEVSLGELLDPGSIDEYQAEREGRLWSIPFYRFSGRRVWGATAMMLAELAELLKANAGA